MNVLRTILLLAAFPGLSAAETPKVKSPAGMWNDGLVGENTGLYFATDGSGDYISLACYALRWSYDPALQIVSVWVHVSGQETKASSLRFRYDAERQILTSIDMKRGEFDWCIQKADRRHVDSWLEVKRKNEAKGKK